MCLASPLLAVDSDLLRYIGPDTKQIAGAYVDRVVSSPLGLFLQSKAGAENRDFINFVTATGFDPRRDLREVIVASPGQAQARKGLIAARGAFNGAQLGALAVLSAGKRIAIRDRYLFCWRPQCASGLLFRNPRLHC